MKIVDQIGNNLLLSSPPKRIVSLVPSQTEYLLSLGLDNELVGITKYCIHPKEKIDQIPTIGGTKNPKIDKIKSLKPDLVIANKEENRKQDINLISRFCKVYVSDIKTIKDATKMMLDLGEILEKQKRAEEICNAIEIEFGKLQELNNQGKSVAYIIWKKPLMLAGEDTFIGQLLRQCKLNNYTEKKRYPVYELKDLCQNPPDLVFLSSEPYPFKEKHLNYFKKMIPSATVKLVDGELFSWYGYRLLFFPNYVLNLLQ